LCCVRWGTAEGGNHRASVPHTSRSSLHNRLHDRFQHLINMEPVAPALLRHDAGDTNTSTSGTASPRSPSRVPTVPPCHPGRFAHLSDMPGTTRWTPPQRGPALIR